MTGYLEPSSNTAVDSGMGVRYETGRAMRPNPDNFDRVV